MRKWWKGAAPPTGIVYPFLFSTQLITDLRTLNLDGNDELFLWEKRRRGFSLFAFAPLEAASHGATRSQMIFFEETAAQHGPTERAAMAKLSETLADVPSTSDRLYRWIDHFHLSLAMFFGPACPVLPKTASSSPTSATHAFSWATSRPITWLSSAHPHRGPRFLSQRQRPHL
jgi:hypothetical protein